MMESKYGPYMLSTHYTAGKLMKYENDISEFIGGDWEQMSFEQKEQILDDFIVDNEIRALYKDSSIDEHTDLMSSFPKLIIQTGEKIVVDCENDFSTWRDEHSGPFSWKSRSQQDLRLEDLDPDKINKPLAKHSTSTASKAEDVFPWQSEPWTSKITANYRIHMDRIDTSSRKSPLEEVNKGFQGSTENLPERSPSLQTSSSHTSPSKPNVLKSPSIEDSHKPVAPTRQVKTFVGKFPNVRASEKSPNDDTYAVVQLLPKQTISETAYSNPTMTNEFSTFIGQDAQNHDVNYESQSFSSSEKIDEISPGQSMLCDTQNSIDSVGSQDEIEDIASLSLASKIGFDFLDEW